MTYITKLLLETNQLLQTKISKHEIIETGCNQLSNLLNRNIVYYDIVDGEIQDPLIFKDDFRDADKEFQMCIRDSYNYHFIFNIKIICPLDR